MTESPAIREISFFRLAEQYDKMTRLRRTRWRERRDTLPARRRRRRLRRRQHGEEAEYFPIEVDGGEANRGVRARLLGAAAAASVTALCLMSVVAAPAFTLATIFALTVAIGSLGLSISLAVSARDEELVHQIAGRLNQEVADEPPGLPDHRRQGETEERPSHSVSDGLTSVDPTPRDPPSMDVVEDGELEWRGPRCTR